MAMREHRACSQVDPDAQKMIPSESPSNCIGQIAQLLASIVATCDDQERAAAYYEAAHLIDELNGLDTLESVFGDEAKARQRLMDLRRHLSIVAELSKPDFFSVEEHHLKALGAIVSLELQARQARSASYRS
jgi:hypothetical protein